MFMQYSQFFIISRNFSLGTFKKYSSPLYFLISAYVNIGAITSPMIMITITEIIAVILVLVMFYSACREDSLE